MRLPVGLASPSALTVYGTALDMRDVLFVAVNQSGRSPDLVDSLTVAHAHGAMFPVLERLTALGAHIVGVGPGADLPIAADGIAEHLLPILEILPLQRLARRLALDRGIDPDRPRGLSKVTQTL